MSEKEKELVLPSALLTSTLLCGNVIDLMSVKAKFICDPLFSRTYNVCACNPVNPVASNSNRLNNLLRKKHLSNISLVTQDEFVTVLIEQLR